jgi:hypothetical protein
MSTPNRVNIEQKAVNAPENKTSQGVTVKDMLSLFDVPEGASADFDKEKRIISLNFDYIGGEETTVEKATENAISLVLGKNSNRLYGIKIALEKIPEFSPDKFDYELVIEVAEEGMENYQKTHPKIKSRSFEALNRVLKTYSSELGPMVERVLVTS